MNHPVLSGDPTYEIKYRLEITKAKIELLKAHKELVALADEFPEVEISSADEKRFMSDIAHTLTSEICKEFKDIGIDMPEGINIMSFSEIWIKENWVKTVGNSGCRIDFIPKHIVELASRDLLLKRNEISETLEELLELNRRGPWKYHPSVRKLTFKMRNFRDRINIAHYESVKKMKKVLRLNFDHIDVEISRLTGKIGERKERLKKVMDIEKKSRASRRAKEIRDTRRQHSIQQMVTSLSFFFTGLSALFMLAMLCVGGLALGYALMQIKPDNPYEGMKTAMSKSLTALELILLAPLPYLLVLGLMRYIKALAFQERADEFRRELLEFKAFEVALFIAIIAASVVSRVLDDRLNFSFAISVSMILVVLAAYYYLIEQASEKASEVGVGQHNPNKLH